MEPSFWIEAWQQGRRGFHVDTPNPLLTRFAPQELPAGARVLVPLCGATHDLRWLAEHGWSAVGVELSPLAVDELVRRDGLRPAGERRWEGDGITLFCQDFFELGPSQVGPVDAIWDRAALVALHPTQRARYVAHQRALLGGRGTLLLNALAYDQARLDGPPWSVDGDAVAALWPEAEAIWSARRPVGDRFVEAGIADVDSTLYRARLGASG